MVKLDLGNSIGRETQPTARRSGAVAGLKPAPRIGEPTGAFSSETSHSSRAAGPTRAERTFRVLRLFATPLGVR